MRDEIHGAPYFGRFPCPSCIAHKLIFGTAILCRQCVALVWSSALANLGENLAIAGALAEAEETGWRAGRRYALSPPTRD